MLTKLGVLGGGGRGEGGREQRMEICTSHTRLNKVRFRAYGEALMKARASNGLGDILRREGALGAYLAEPPK